MEQLMNRNMKNDVIYYGIYSTADDMWNGTDVLCAARKRFFETGTKQKKRSSIQSENQIFHFNYSIEAGEVLKYKKMKAGHSVERVAETPEGYCVETIDDQRKPLKRVYYNLQHLWLRTDYLSAPDNSISLSVSPSESGDQPVLLCKTARQTETLIPFQVSLDKELTQRLNVLTCEPKIFCVTSYGSFYYCTEKEAELREEALKTLLQEKEENESKESASRQTDSAFVVAVAEANSSVAPKSFNLKNSPEIRIDEEALSEPETEASSGTETDSSSGKEAVHQKKEAPEKSGENVVDNPSVPEKVKEAAESDGNGRTSSVEAAEAPGLPEADGLSEESDDSMRTNSDTPATVEKPKRSVVKKTTVKMTDSPQEATNDSKRKAAGNKQLSASDRLSEKDKASQEEAAEPVEVPLFGIAKDEPASVYERVCSFANDCPYETVDKQIIESGGRQYYYFGDLVDNQRSGRGRTVMKNGETAYEGGYREDKRDGFGVYYYKSGKLCYAGGWKQNQRDGLGIAFSPSDGGLIAGRWEKDESVGVASHYDAEGHLLYTGTVANGKRSGAGITYHKADQTFFVGKYKDGIFLETGTQFSAQGVLLYTGGYQDHCRSGEGTSYREDGSIHYQGQWLHNQYDGQGTLYLDDGSSISGSFKNGRANGKCTLTNADGMVVYIGSFMEDAYNGTGRLFSEDGSYAEGRFVDGEPTGVFYEYNAQKQLVYCGEWEDMHRNGRGMEYRDGEKCYEGDFRDAQYHGEGKLFEKGATVYSGSFVHGKREGFGVEYRDNEPYYKGMWKDDQYNGCGILYENNEAAYIGFFSEGKRNGRINQIKDRAIFRKSLYTNDELTYTCEYEQDGSLVYYGNMSGEMRSGMGCTFHHNAEKQFEGIFRNNEPDKAMKVFLKELPELPVCPELDHTEYALYRVTPEYIIEKNLTIGNHSGIYTGRLKNGQPEGSGTILFSDHRYTGFFSEGKPKGEGVVYLRDGEECKGIFKTESFADCKTLVMADITYFYQEIL